MTGKPKGQKFVTSPFYDYFI